MIFHLVPEGYMEELVGRRLLAVCGHSLGTIYDKIRGYARIREKAAYFHYQATTECGVLVLTDFRDSGAACPPDALQEYIFNKLLPQFGSLSAASSRTL